MPVAYGLPFLQELGRHFRLDAVDHLAARDVGDLEADQGVDVGIEPLFVLRDGDWPRCIGERDFADQPMGRRVGDQDVVRALRPQVHALAVGRAERVVRTPPGGDLRDDSSLLRVDDPPRGIVAWDVGYLAIGGASELVRARADRHPSLDRIGKWIEPEELAKVAPGVLYGDEDLVAVLGRDKTVRLGPELHAFDHLIGGGIDDVEVVARGIGHVELLNRLFLASDDGKGSKRQCKHDGGELHGPSVLLYRRVRISKSGCKLTSYRAYQGRRNENQAMGSSYSYWARAPQVAKIGAIG